MTFAQTEFVIRCEWGENGVAQLAPISNKLDRVIGDWGVVR
jgi:hypothetical protein